MDKTKQSWSIVIFCYNEKETVRRVAESARKVLARIGDERSEIVIVDDGSTDGSADIVRDIAALYPNVTAVYHRVNIGIGPTLRDGYFAAKNDNLCAVPADGQFDLDELIPFAAVDEKTFVSFYRKNLSAYTLFRKLVTGLNKNINRIFLGIDLRDVNWVKIYKRKEILALDLQLRSSLIESEICSKLALAGNRCIESPSVYHQREAGRAKGASFITLFRAGRELFKLVRVIAGYRRGLSIS